MLRDDFIMMKSTDKEIGQNLGWAGLFAGEHAGSMCSECLNICSGNELLLWIPCGSTYILVTTAGKKSTADNLS